MFVLQTRLLRRQEPGSEMTGQPRAPHPSLSAWNLLLACKDEDQRLLTGRGVRGRPLPVLAAFRALSLQSAARTLSSSTQGNQIPLLFIKL